MVKRPWIVAACLLAGVSTPWSVGMAQAAEPGPPIEQVLAPAATPASAAALGARALESKPAADAIPPAPAAADNSRWAEAMSAFAAADKLHPPKPGGVVFVGSSSIRLWQNLEGDFKTATVIKRGFGGSKLSDCVDYLPRLVTVYQPKQVVVYAGDNDLASGEAPKDVLASFKALVEGIRKELPEARIAYVSIKPSPSREKLMPEIRQTNNLIRDYSATIEGVDYIDIFTAMVDAQGKPRPELFSRDMLHMNAQGYQIWQQAISARLR
jgi:lysophospholipase L1-like esterase